MDRARHHGQDEALASFLLLLSVWFGLTATGFVDPMFLPGHVDSVWSIALPARTQELKLAPEFLHYKREITQRIRATSGMVGDFSALQALATA